MAGVSTYSAKMRAQAESESPTPPPPANLPMQKKILENLLECIVQLKADFFENNQPLTDDSIVLQRFCAKFEHFLQIGMKEKVSLLGRKKDYWDYFCDCLGSSKGINDGIKYVKSLGENKTSLGKGRAFIRFCLVHQRLADTMQQCVVNDKTYDWFNPGTLLTNPKECQNLIGCLYDLNSLHFDLSPRGYDLDASWPAFANRKNGGGGSWNVPLSRRSSMTSMDAISQISVSVDNSAEVDRLAKDLEVAQSAKSDLVGQIGTLQQERAQASQSAWATQGELQASQQQLRELQTQLVELQSKYQELDVSHVKLKLEKEHQEKAHADELRTLNAKFEEEANRRVTQLAAEEEMWKRERQEEASRVQREVDKAMADAKEANRRAEAEEARADDQSRMLREMLAEADVKAENGDFRSSVSSLAQSMKALQLKLAQLTEEKSTVQNQLQGEQSDKGKQLSLLEGRLLEQEKALREAQESSTSLQTQAAKMELELKGEKEKTSRLEQEKAELESILSLKEVELKSNETEFGALKSKVSELELKNASLSTETDYLKMGTEKTEALSSEIKGQLESAKVELAKVREDAEKTKKELDHKCEDLSAQVKSLTGEISSLQANVRDKDVEIGTLRESAHGETSQLQNLLQKKDEEIAASKLDLEKASAKLDTVSKEAAELGEGNLVLNEKLALAEGEAETLRSGCRDVEGKVINLEGEVEKMIQESHEKDARLAQIDSQNSLLRQEVKEKNEALESVRSELEKSGKEMKATKEQKEEELVAVKAELATALAEKGDLKKDMDVEKSRMLGLLKESEGVKRSESEKEEKISSLILELESLRREKESDVTQLEERARVLNSQINEKDAKVSELSEKVGSLSSELTQEKEANAKLASSGEEVRELREKLAVSETNFKGVVAKMDAQASEERQQHENEVTSFTERIKVLESQISAQEQSRNASCLEYEGKIAELQKVRDDLASAASDSHEQLTKLGAELATLTEDKILLATRLDEAEGESRQLQDRVAELSQQVKDHQAEVQSSTEEKTSLQVQVATMAEEMTKLEDARDELERQASEMKEHLQTAEDEAQEKLALKKDMELKLGEAESKLEEAEQNLRKAESQLEEAELAQLSQSQKSQFSAQVLEESLVEARKTLEEVRAERSQLQDSYDQLSAEKDEMQSRLQEMEADKREMSEQIEAMSKQVSSSDVSDVEKLSEQLDEERKTSKMTVETLNEEISALQFQLSAVQMQGGDGQGRSLEESAERTKGELRAVISDQEIIIERLEQELEAAQETKQLDSSQVSILEHKVEKAEESLKSSESRLSQASARLEQEISARRKLEAELTSLRTTFSQSVEDKVAIIKNLESDNAQYKKKLIKLVRDKDTLWHKTDELVSAQKRKSEERWQDNAEVTHCLQCKTEFSLFVRKHHCRLCGRIFCWACSDFWLDSTLSSKKVRCCKSCFDSHTDSGATLSASMVDNASDDEEEEEEEGAEGENASGSGAASQEGSTAGNSASVDSRKPAGVLTSSQNQTDDGKVKQRASHSVLSVEGGSNAADDNEDSIYDHNYDNNNDDDVDNGGGGGGDGDDEAGEGVRRGTIDDAGDDKDAAVADDDVDDLTFQVISEEEIMKSMTQYNREMTASTSVPSNMSSSMILSAEELESGEVNQQNEVWVKPGKTFAVPVHIEEKNTVLHWSFTSHPKDIVFSVSYRADESVELSSAEEIVAPCKCDSHKQTVRGELTAKQSGIYSLVFDNTYSKLTSKKVHYRLEYKKNA